MNEKEGVLERRAVRKVKRATNEKKVGKERNLNRTVNGRGGFSTERRRLGPTMARKKRLAGSSGGVRRKKESVVVRELQQP